MKPNFTNCIVNAFMWNSIRVGKIDMPYDRTVDLNQNVLFTLWIGITFINETVFVFISVRISERLKANSFPF